MKRLLRRSWFAVLWIGSLRSRCICVAAGTCFFDGGWWMDRVRESEKGGCWLWSRGG